MLAVLFTYVPETGECMATPFDASHGDPILKAEALRASCEDDFPGAIWSIGSDEEALKVTANRRMKELLGEDWEPTT